jgi:hypothetical protein
MAGTFARKSAMTSFLLPGTHYFREGPVRSRLGVPNIVGTIEKVEFLGHILAVVTDPL